MGRYEELKAKCSGGVGPNCTEREYNEYVWLDQYGSDAVNPPSSSDNSAGSWFERIIGGISDLSGVAFGIHDRATGYQPGVSYAAGAQPGATQTGKGMNALWVLVAIAGGIGIIILIVYLVKRGKKGKPQLKPA